MAAALVERAWRDTAPEAVEHTLAALWRDIAHHGAVARAIMSNLVIFRYHERRSSRRAGGPIERTGASFSDVVDAVVARHPSRTIVIEHDRGDHDASAPMSAGVAVSIFGPPAARYGVESIVVRSACAEASLPSIVRRFARGGVPTSVWWTEDLSSSPLLSSLVDMARQLVYDSRSWQDPGAGVRALTSLPEPGAPDVADLNWRRLRPVRDLLVHAAGRCGQAAVAANRVTIAHRPGDAALAALLAGWLAARLEWPETDWPSIVQSEGDECLTLTIRDRDFVLRAALDERRAQLDAPGYPTFLVTAAREETAEAVAAELRSLRCDTGLRDALRALARREPSAKP